MDKFELTTTGKTSEFLDKFLEVTTRPRDMIREVVPQYTASFRKKVRPLGAGKKVTIYVTHFPELCQLNGLSCPVDDRSYMNLAVPNFLASRLKLEPVGHELALEVFGQGLHYSAIPVVEQGFVICTTRANCQPCEWSDDHQHLLNDSYAASAIRLEQKREGQSIAYPTSHVARAEERMLLLYAKWGSEHNLFGPTMRIMGM